MNVLIILGHPDKNSFNHAIALTCMSVLENNGHKVFFHNLYAEKFNPVHHFTNAYNELSEDEMMKNHYDELIKSDAIIIIHPNWWGQPPAIVKGWIDRVLLKGLAYDFEQNENGDLVPVGLLKAHTALVFNTSNTLENTTFPEPLELIWKNQVFKLCGVKYVERINFGIMKMSEESQRLHWLSEVRFKINSLFQCSQ